MIYVILYNASLYKLKSATNNTVVRSSVERIDDYYPQGTVHVRLGLTYHFYIPQITQSFNPFYISTSRDNFLTRLDATSRLTTFIASVNNISMHVIAFVPSLQLNTTHLFYSSSRKLGMGGMIEIID